jgi:hypothetical protein
MSSPHISSRIDCKPVTLRSLERFGLSSLKAPYRSRSSTQSRLFDKLYFVKERHKKHDDPSAKHIFGRCAETYPAVDIQ